MNKTICRFAVLCLACLMALLPSSVRAEIHLPQELTVLESEAFSNSALFGVLDLSGTAVRTIADGALDSTGICGMVLSADTQSVGKQHFAGELAFVIDPADCPARDLSGLGTPKFFFAPPAGKDKLACTAYPDAEADETAFCPLGSVTEEGGFYYFIDNGEASLLCPADSFSIAPSVTVPDTVDGCPVTSVSVHAFYGLFELTDLSLPFGCTVADHALDAFPEARVTVRTNTITIWCSAAALPVFREVLDAFFASSAEYADWSYALEEHSEANAIDDLYNAAGAYPGIYCFPQDQTGLLYSMGMLSPVTGGTAGQDSSFLNGAAVDGTVYAYPMTSDNGFFMYYNTAVVSDPSDLAAVLADCEEKGATFNMELNGWYWYAFWGGTGCSMEYTYTSDGTFTPNIDIANAKGLAALKAMISMHRSGAFVSNSSVRQAGSSMGAVVSGLWDNASARALLGDHYGVRRLPAFSGYQMSSFSGCKYIGVVPGQSGEALALSHILAQLLTSESTQVRLHDEAGWTPSRAAARSAVQMSAAERALAAQNVYSSPQGSYPGAYWDAVSAFTGRLMDGDFDGMDDGALMSILSSLEATLAAITH